MRRPRADGAPSDRWRRVEALYHEMLAHPPAERAGALAAACSDDPELLREVRSLLEEPESAAGFLSTPAVRVAAGLASGINALFTGQRIGVFEVRDLIGVGGMGEVYRALDTSLGRKVAIKVLPEAFAHDLERLARFTREARTLASLNHPNIATTHGIENIPSADGSEPGGRALIMELVEGEDLSSRIARGPIPLAETLPLARQIAEALEEAHEHGVIHRDQKPGNIRITENGKVKVLDFGLAKAGDRSLGAGSRPDDSAAATLSRRDPEQGTLIGTAAYMSPEQAAGKSADKRADIWAFGVVLGEMLTGKRLFRGETTSETLAAILATDPDWSGLPPSTPPPLVRLLDHCLKKDPRDRLRDIGEARQQLEELWSGSGDDLTARAAGRSAGLFSRREGWPALTWPRAVLLLGFLIVLGLGGARWRAGSSAGPALTLTPLSFEPGGQTRAVWSPDGRAVAFAARERASDPFQVYVRYLDSPVATRITQIRSSALPLQWTTSGKIIYFSMEAPTGAWAISPLGGEPEPLQPLDWPRVRGMGSISRDGAAAAVPYFGQDRVFGVWIASPPGSALKPYEPAPFASPDFFNGALLDFSPDGKQILLIGNASQGQQAWLLPYPPDASHPPRRVLQNLKTTVRTPAFSWMPDGRHIVLSATSVDAPQQLYLADTLSGAIAPFSNGTTIQDAPAVSPDGRSLVFLEEARDFDIVSVDLTSAAITPLIATQRSEEAPAWASRKTIFVYVTDRNGGPEIWLHQAGADDRPLVTARDFKTGVTQAFIGPSLSPDGARVIYSRVEQDGPVRLWISAVAGGPPVRLVKGNPEIDFPGSWSPDGVWYVYRHIEAGREFLNKVKTTGQSQPEALVPAKKRLADWAPLWSPSGEWILYASGGVRLISPDGRDSREVSPTSAVVYAFSEDGGTLYGIRWKTEDRLELFSMNLATRQEKSLAFFGAEFAPANSLNPSLRLSLAPGGRSLAFSAVKTTSNLWLMHGLDTLILPR